MLNFFIFTFIIYGMSGIIKMLFTKRQGSYKKKK